MRLLKKFEIDKHKVIEKQRELEEGMKLAKRVDGLRELISEEETGLKKFRENTIKDIFSELKPLIEKKEKLSVEIPKLEKTRMELLAPVNLKEAWSKVKNDEEKNKNWESSLLDRETKLIIKESSLENKDKDLFIKEESLKEKERLTENYLKETRKNYDLSENVRYEIDYKKKKNEKDWEEKSRELKNREEEVFYREENIKNQKIKIEKDKKQIDDDKLHIKSQQESLRVAWMQIKRLQK